MDDAEFLERAQRIRDWFTPLNPYTAKGPVFKIEDANYRLKGDTLTDELEPLHCFAISPKRHGLFNLDERGRPVLRKASAHGLGHLRPAYGEKHAPRSIPKPAIPLHDLGVERWEYDLWYRIVQAALGGHPDQVKIDDLPGFDKRAMSRYAATTPALLRWFRKFNAGKDYRDCVRPFGFICAFQAWSTPQAALSVDELAGRLTPRQRKRTLQRARLDAPQAVSPFDKEPDQAAAYAFDRETGNPIPVDQLMTYRQAVAQYHLHPDPKFLDADYLDSGYTERRHIEASILEYIGKEANRWEEQFFLGENPDAQVMYGAAPDEIANTLANITSIAQQFGQRRLAKAARQSRSKLANTLKQRGRSDGSQIRRLMQAGDRLTDDQSIGLQRTEAVLEQVRQRLRAVGLRRYAGILGVDPTHLRRTLGGQRPIGAGLLQRIMRDLAPRSDDLTT
jgi:hypothetical protein